MPTAKTFSAIGIAGFAVDIAAKYLAQNPPHALEGFFVFFVNREFAWGIPIGNSASALLMVFAIAAIIAYWRAAPREKRQELSPLALALSGAFGNLASRVAWGGVVDYIAVPWGGVINLSDVMVAVGVVFFLVAKVPKSKIKT
ncbi:MAG: signal peptidase II [Parcubacteria group bacterium]|nr:signal peptidase II [Parcubacteria group bacterium]